MSKTVLANLGNRNLLYKNKFIPDYIKANQLNNDHDFRSFTQYLLDRFNEEEKNIKPNILNELLESKTNEIVRLILFATNQQDENHQGSDTVFEAEILKKLFEKQYPHISTEIKEIYTSPVDTDKLMKYYNKSLKEIRREKPDIDLIIFDAGGTAQQKYALKILTEFLFYVNQFQVFYSDPKKPEGQRVYEIENIEYRNIIVKEQIISLINEYDYLASSRLYVSNKDENKLNKDVSFKLLQFLRYRKDQLFNLADHYANINNYPNWVKQSQEIVLLLNNFFNRIPTAGSDGSGGLLSEESLFRLSESLQLIKVYKNREDYSSLVLTINQFIENYLYSVISDNTEYDLISNYYKFSEKLFSNKVYEEFPYINKTLQKHPELDITKEGIPALVIMVEQFENAQNLAFVSDFKQLIYYFIQDQKFNKKGIDTYRNKVAHQNIGVTKEDWENKLAHIPGIVENWFERFRVSEKSIYDKANEIVINTIQ